MTDPVILASQDHLPPSHRLIALLAVGAARLLATLSPCRIRGMLQLVRGDCAPATAHQALTARHAVVSVSVRCAGRNCLQRSLAAALLCRMQGVWLTWCTGVRTDPFRAHAWVEVDGVPIGETFGPGYYTPVITVPAARSQRNPGPRGPSAGSGSY
ncbi:MAG: lasso peptide biosynthesis B2 protein [Pseudonocardiaceae bacterium]